MSNKRICNGYSGRSVRAPPLRYFDPARAQPDRTAHIHPFLALMPTHVSRDDSNYSR